MQNGIDQNLMTKIVGDVREHRAQNRYPVGGVVPGYICTEVPRYIRTDIPTYQCTSECAVYKSISISTDGSLSYYVRHYTCGKDLSESTETEIASQVIGVQRNITGDICSSK